MKKQYDYYLLIMKDDKGDEIHMPMPFQVGIHPEAYCKALVTAGDYQSYEIKPLVIAEQRV